MKLLVCIAIVGCFFFFNDTAGFSGQAKGQKKHYTSIEDVPLAVWKKIEGKKIYFGHQSVGLNVIQGIQELMDEYNFIHLNINSDINKFNVKSGVFLHSKIGKNKKPFFKISSFKKILTGGLGENLDVAGFKFCFVDFKKPDQNQEILNKYIDTINEIKSKFPELTIVHFTVPLMSIRLNWKDKIKKIIGRKVSDNSVENMARNKYNTLLRKQLGPDAFLFDIAKVESTFPDGSRCTFKRDGKAYFAMVPEYTYDGGHLTEIGRRKVAEQFMLFLTSII